LHIRQASHLEERDLAALVVILGFQPLHARLCRRRMLSRSGGFGGRGVQHGLLLRGLPLERAQLGLQARVGTLQGLDPQLMSLIGTCSAAKVQTLKHNI
jgi:hypothetical protein